MRITYFAVLGTVLVGTALAQTDWPTFGNDLAGTRYSPLKQIDTKNVNKQPPRPPRRARAGGGAGEGGAEDATGRSRRW